MHARIRTHTHAYRHVYMYVYTHRHQLRQNMTDMVLDSQRHGAMLYAKSFHAAKDQQNELSSTCKPTKPREPYNYLQPSDVSKRSWFWMAPLIEPI